jgi:hypothetical protein
MGHTVHFIDASSIDDSNFSSLINSIEIDFYLSTNVFNKIHEINSIDKKYNYQSINHKMIFIHHDSAFCPPDNIENINNKLHSLRKHQEQIYHFFIEEKNIDEFTDLGIRNCYPLRHASEFKRLKAAEEPHEYEVSFVGHLLSGLSEYPINRDDFGHHLIGLAWSRYSKSSFEIQPNIKELSQSKYLYKEINDYELFELSKHRHLMQLMTNYSMAYRGEIISNIKNCRIDIFGGDLSYGSIKSPLMKIDKSNIFYHQATGDYGQAEAIYSKSKISLNISSFQFDSALNNRIIDIVLSGGFVLTDRRSDLIKYTKYWREISFDTPEELQHLIDFYLDEKNISKYLEVKSGVYNEFINLFSYPAVCSEILTNVLN